MISVQRLTDSCPSLFQALQRQQSEAEARGVVASAPPAPHPLLLYPLLSRSFAGLVPPPVGPPPELVPPRPASGPGAARPVGQGVGRGGGGECVEK